MSYYVEINGFIKFSKNTNMTAVFDKLNEFDINSYDYDRYNKYIIEIFYEDFNYNHNEIKKLFQELCYYFKIESGKISITDEQGDSWYFEYNSCKNNWDTGIMRTVYSGKIISNNDSHCCSKCGAIAKQSANFCYNCGAIFTLTNDEKNIINNRKLN